MRILAFLILFFITLTAFAKEKALDVDLRRTEYSLEEQNIQADKEELPRLSEKDLQRFKESGFLVPLPRWKMFVVIDERLPVKYRFCTKQTYLFLLASGVVSRFWTGKPLKVTSAIRTTEYQDILKKVNQNAADSDGPKRSSHLTGATIDITKVGMTKRQLEWVRGYLHKLMKDGYIHVTEEFHQAVFHIMVFKKFEELHTPHTEDHSQEWSFSYSFL